jgi:hypothetical protein
MHLILILLVFFLPEASAHTFVSKSNVPKLMYRFKRPVKKLDGKEYITVKGKGYVILAKKYTTNPDGYSYWKTIKIRIKDKAAVKEWPYTIQQLLKDYEQSSDPKQPVVSINLYASPISFAVLNKSRNINTGYSLRSLNSEKHELSQETSINEMFQESFGVETSSMTLNSSLVYDYNDFYGNWTYFAVANYRRQKFNGDYPLKHQYGLGFLGLKYKFIRQGNYVKKLDLSYIPIFERVESDFNIAYPGEDPTNSQSILRHSFRLRTEAEYHSWRFRYMLFYRPAYYFNINTLDMQDIDLSSTLEISTNITDRIQLSYTNTYTKDIRLFRANGMREDNTINSFSINVTFEF